MFYSKICNGFYLFLFIQFSKILINIKKIIGDNDFNYNFNYFMQFHKKANVFDYE